MSRLPPLKRSAACLACTCRSFRAAHAASWWPSLDPATGNVLEPHAGRFWRELSPGDDLQAAVDACPRGACMLLRPGTHRPGTQSQEPLQRRYGLRIDKRLHIFGRGQATLEGPVPLSGAVRPWDFGSTCVYLAPGAFRATLDGLVVRVPPHVGLLDEHEEFYIDTEGVRVEADQARLQSLDVSGCYANVVVRGCRFSRLGAISTGSRIEPTIAKCRCDGGRFLISLILFGGGGAHINLDRVF